MANPSQSQDVEHKGPRPDPLELRQRKSSGTSDKSAQGELKRKAPPSREQQEGKRSKVSQHGSNTPSRPD